MQDVVAELVVLGRATWPASPSWDPGNVPMSSSFASKESETKSVSMKVTLVGFGKGWVGGT